MIRFLLDANTIIALKNNRSHLLLNRIRAHRPGEIALSAIVLHELYYGAFRSQQLARNLEVVRLLRQDFEILDFDAEDAREAGDIRADLVRAGRPIGPYDVLIAGQAAARSLVLVTSNTGEFSRIPRLKLEDWTLPPLTGFHED
ncbi:type II toxin-antitoxin system VapC family toxin [Labrys okinawensis]|uniref:type II toxin-antitoxin system VapC family toxin n=1 Tax=Labrys okinawensis TaxID=346911 RepID=UPI0039BC243D